MATYAEEGMGGEKETCIGDNLYENNADDQSEEPLLLPVSPTKPKVEMKIDIPLQKQTSLKVPTPSYQKQQSTLSNGPIRIAVYIKRHKEHNSEENIEECGHYIIELERGRQTTAGEIKDQMLDNLAIPRSSGHLFAMWLISPYLELQLKFQHPPFYLRKQWCDLLLQLSSCPVEEIPLDEPVLVFQRNSFITVEEERNETNPSVLKHLFHEAAFNVLNARYPVPIEDAERLGGILLRCYEGEFKVDIHKPGFFRKELNKFLPYYAIGSNKISQAIYSAGAEQRLLLQYEEASKKYTSISSCYAAFLDYCRDLHFYGCAFFKGSCFMEGVDYKIWKSDLQPVTVGLNRYGVTLFKAEMEEVLAHLPYKTFSWDLKNDELDDPGNPSQRFIIEYDDETEVRQIMIVSKQSCLMDAMVESCVKFIEDVPVLSDAAAVKDRRKLLSISYKLSDFEEGEMNVVSA